MNKERDALQDDIRKVESIPMVNTILDVICQTTGMGFAAIARVTNDRWIACCVRDDIEFGLKAGGELKLETTICNEIRVHQKEVIIDSVEKDDRYRTHHTPLLYGFQSYVSIPIILKSGEFFGTLCAIDPKPNQLNNSKVRGMFNLFTELIAFHLHSITLMEQSEQVITEMSRQLLDSTEENRQYHHISNHNLQEPLRKIRLYSNMLVNAADVNDVSQTKNLAMKIGTGAQRISMMIADLSSFSDLAYSEDAFEEVDLNRVLADVCAQLDVAVRSKKARISYSSLPTVDAITFQMEQLFFHLINNALKFSREDVRPLIKIATAVENKAVLKIEVSDNGPGIPETQLEKIFDIFSQLNPEDSSTESFGVGLAYCRKIVRIHKGEINVRSNQNAGTTIHIQLPLQRAK